MDLTSHGLRHGFPRPLPETRLVPSLKVDRPGMGSDGINLQTPR